METAAPPPPCLDLPAEFAAALDAHGEVLVKHPGSGARLRLRPSPARSDAAPEGGFRGRRSLSEAVRAGITDADAGRTMSVAEARTRMAAKHSQFEPA